MLPVMEPALCSINEARSLISKLSNELLRDDELSAMPTTVYDTAWVSMVAKKTDNGSCWLFPETFNYILQTQLPDGSWDAYASAYDGVLNTSAALLALKYHSGTSGHHGCVYPDNLEERINWASQGLQSQLQSLEVDDNLPVGFEILLPAMLCRLEQLGLTFEYPARETLVALESQKFAKFIPEALYLPCETTVLHSLEALVGRVDFDRLDHHLTEGAMMNSPSATAAYLMYASRWNLASEAYLRRAISSGGFASAYPTTTFEISWALSTLLGAGYTSEQLGQATCSLLYDFLEKQLYDGQGITGFAPGVMADADDTAKAIETLFLAGRKPDVTKLIKTYERASHFTTYPNERDPSMSANCNILVALLRASVDSRYSTQITKATVFLCDLWDVSKITDKWNISPYYSMMRLVEAIMLFLSKWDAGIIEGLPSDLIEHKIPVVLTQIALHILREQLPDGSWGSKKSAEESAYALSALKSVNSLPWLQPIEDATSEAITRGKDYVLSREPTWKDPDYLWIEKVSYKSSVLSQAYCIASVRDRQTWVWNASMPKLIDLKILRKQIAHMATLFACLPSFKSTETWNLHASIIESCLFIPRLTSIRQQIFPFKATTHKHLLFIPITWIAINNLKRHKTRLNNIQLWDMMVKSLFNYQVDMYIETEVKALPQLEVEDLKDFIRSDTVQAHRTEPVPVQRSPRPEGPAKVVNSSGEGHTDLKTTLLALADHTLQHPAHLCSNILWGRMYSPAFTPSPY